MRPRRTPYDPLTIEALLTEAGNPPLSRTTYLYVDLEGRIQAMQKRDRTSQPWDEAESLGYACRFLRSHSA